MISADAIAWNIPIGKPLYETGGWIGHPRVSPKGDLIAFIDHPVQGDDSGSLAVIDLAGNKKNLSGEWFTIQGLAWSPDGKEIWFTASKSGVDRTLYATALDGKERMVLRLPGALMMFDICKDGRVLADARQLAPRTGRHDSPAKPSSMIFPGSITPIRRTFGRRQNLLFDEEGGGGSLDYSKSGGLSYAVYIRKTDGSPAVLFRRRRSGGFVARRQVGDRADSGLALAIRLLTTGAGEAEGSDQRQHESLLGALVSRRQAHFVFRKRARQGSSALRPMISPRAKASRSRLKA